MVLIKKPRNAGLFCWPDDWPVTHKKAPLQGEGLSYFLMILQFLIYAFSAISGMASTL
jgi:hypothetical protein